MKPDVCIRVALYGGIAGAAFSLLCLVMSGAADNNESYRAYLIASAIVFGCGLIAAAMKKK